VYANLSSTKPKNIIFMVGDGFGPASQTFARVASGKEHLFLDEILVGTSRTYSSDSPVTDSAAGATAFACGLKSYNGAIGVSPDGKPCGTLLEAALKNGMKSGLVSTTLLSDATPAAFSAHALYRSQLTDIAKQQIEGLQRFLINGKKYALDVFLGGGRAYFAGKASKDFASARTDDWDGIDKANEQGYNFCSDKDGMSKVNSLPIMGLFSDYEMKFNIDRITNDPEPTLLEMATKAIGLLSSNNDKGFFLMIEGARIDHAGHNNDISAQYREVIQYNDVAQYVIEWAKKDGQTLVVSTADHETGGVTLAKDVDSISNYYYNISVPLKINKSTYNMAVLTLADVSKGTSLNDAVRNMLVSSGVNEPITDREMSIAVSIPDTITQHGNVTTLMLGFDEVINRRARIGFSTTGHTGVDVNVYSFGPSREVFIGNQQNIDLGNKIATMMGFNLKDITEILNK